MQKSRNRTATSEGKYVARVCHDSTVTLDQFASRLEHACSLTRADIKGALCAFGDELVRCLKNGDKVVLDDIGTFKLEMECVPVDNPKDFDPEKHVRRFQLHVIPESKGGRKTLYDNIKLTRAK